MILYIGSTSYRDFIQQAGGTLSEEIPVKEASALIVDTNSQKAAEAVKEAKKASLPILGILDGSEAVAAAFGAAVQSISCGEGNQEWAVIDATSPIYLELESVIKVARGKPFAVCEDTLPPELDCMSRSEDGKIIALRSRRSPKEYGDVYAVNYDLKSQLTPDGVQIIKNFIQLANA